MRLRGEADKQGWRSHPFSVPRKFRDWLSDQGSLTRRLKQRCQKFSVSPVRVGRFRANLDEGLLGLPAHHLAYIREVLLHCNGRPVVFAHSVVPVGSLRGPWASVSRLGSRPLGEALFSNPRVIRGALQYRRINPGHVLARQARQAGISIDCRSLWARRSLFVLNGHSLLVTEMFLPDVLSINCNQK